MTPQQVSPKKTLQAQGNKMDRFLEHFAKEIEHYTDHYGGKLFD